MNDYVAGRVSERKGKSCVFAKRYPKGRELAKRSMIVTISDHIRGEGEAGACDSLQSKRSMGETEGERARMPQGHFFVHCVYSGRREPYGTPFLPPAGLEPSDEATKAYGFLRREYSLREYVAPVHTSCEQDILSSNSTKRAKQKTRGGCLGLSVWVGPTILNLLSIMGVLFHF